MIMIHAYIKPHKLSAVALALHGSSKISGVSVIDGKGFGRGRANGSPEAISEEAGDFIPVSKLEIVCEDDVVSEVIELIRAAAHTGLRGDGKIYTVPVFGALRISTGDTGVQAV